MKTDKIVLIGTYAKKGVHEMYDTGLLHICSLAADKVECYKDKTTFPFIMEADKKYHFLDNVRLHSIYNYFPQALYKRLLGFIWSSITDIFIYLKTSKNSLIVYAYTNIFTIHTVNFLNYFFHKHVVFSTHGEMELLLNNKRGVLSNLFRTILHHFFTKCKADKGLAFITLGDSLLRNLKLVVSEHNYEHFFVIDCPCYMPEKAVKKPKGDEYRLGILSSPTKGRGLDEIKDFVVKMKNTGVKYTLTIIGRVPESEHPFFEEQHIEYLKGFLPREDYEKKIDNIDYVLSFYPKDSYRLIASGTILDALCLNKPVLTIRNDYYEYVLTKTGYPSAIFDTVEEMVEDFKEGKIKELYNLEFGHSKSYFMPPVISKSFINEIKRIYDDIH